MSVFIQTTPASSPVNHRLRAAISADATLSRLSVQERDGLLAASSLCEFGKGEAVYRAGETADRMWAVIDGEIKVSRRTPTGGQLIIELIRAGEICGASCYAEEGEFIFDAEAMRKTTALRFPVAILEAAAEQNREVMQALMKDYCRRLYHAQHMRSLASENVLGRIACALIYLQDKFGDAIPHSRRIVAELAGTSVESAIRATGTLSEKGLIATERNRIVIRSLSKLREFAHKS